MLDPQVQIHVDGELIIMCDRLPGSRSLLEQLSRQQGVHLD